MSNLVTRVLTGSPYVQHVSVSQSIELLLVGRKGDCETKELGRGHTKYNCWGGRVLGYQIRRWASCSKLPSTALTTSCPTSVEMTQCTYTSNTVLIVSLRPRSIMARPASFRLLLTTDPPIMIKSLHSRAPSRPHWPLRGHKWYL